YLQIVAVILLRVFRVEVINRAASEFLDRASEQFGRTLIDADISIIPILINYKRRNRVEDRLIFEPLTFQLALRALHFGNIARNSESPDDFSFLISEWHLRS